MIPYVENSKDATKKLLELVNEFSKVAKLTYKNLLFFFTIINYQKGKLRKQSQLPLHQKE